MMKFSIDGNFDLQNFMSVCLTGTPSVALEVDDAHPNPDGYLVCQAGVLTVCLNLEDEGQKDTVTMAAAQQGATPIS